MVLFQIRPSRRPQQVPLMIRQQGTIAHDRNTSGLRRLDARSRKSKRQRDANAFKREPRGEICHGHTSTVDAEGDRRVAGR